MRELTFRVQRLERRLDEARISIHRDEGASDSSKSVLRTRAASGALESRIGSQWLNKIGVVAVLFGVAYLLRYAFVNKWMSGATWIWLGVCVGIVVIVGSEWFRRRGYRVLSLSLKATGGGVSYLSLWAGLELYKLLSGLETFSGLVILSLLIAALALRESAEVLAAMALVAGFLTPLLISIPSGGAALLTYIGIFDCACAALVLKPDWWKLLTLGFLGTILLCSTWYFKQYVPGELFPSVAGVTVFFVIFCFAFRCVRRRLPGPRAPHLLTLIEVANPSLYLAALYVLANQAHHHALALPTLGLSALYLLLSRQEENSGKCGAAKFVAVYTGLSIAFIAITLAILLPLDWLSLGWFAEAAIVIAIGFWRDLPWLRLGALLLLCAAVVKVFAYDVWRLSLAYRTLSFIGLGVLLLLISFAYQRYGFSMVGRSGKDAGGGVCESPQD